MKIAFIIHKYFMCRSLLSITVWHLLLHERINVLHSTNIFSHSPFKLVHSSSTFLGLFSLALSFRNFRTFSVGFITGLWAGHSITVTSSSERNVLNRLRCVTRSVILNKYGWLINCSSHIRCNMFVQYLLVYTCVNFTVYPDKRSCNSSCNHAKHYYTSFSKSNAAFSALKRISFLRTVSNKPSSFTTEQIKFWLIAEMNTIPLFIWNVQCHILIGSFCSF